MKTLGQAYYLGQQRTAYSYTLNGDVGNSMHRLLIMNTFLGGGNKLLQWLDMAKGQKSFISC